MHTRLTTRTDDGTPRSLEGITPLGTGRPFHLDMLSDEADDKLSAEIMRRLEDKRTGHARRSER